MNVQALCPTAGLAIRLAANVVFPYRLPLRGTGLKAGGEPREEVQRSSPCMPAATNGGTAYLLSMRILSSVPGNIT